MIEIDTNRYESKTGKKPVGRGFWTFRIVSPVVTVDDQVFTTAVPVTYDAACERAIDLAMIRGSNRVVLVPGD